jgi:hypothetical protein
MNTKISVLLPGTHTQPHAQPIPILSYGGPFFMIIIITFDFVNNGEGLAGKGERRNYFSQGGGCGLSIGPIFCLFSKSFAGVKTFKNTLWCFHVQKSFTWVALWSNLDMMVKRKLL